MLALSRKSGESIQIGADVFVTVFTDSRRPGTVRICIEAPRHLNIRRTEIPHRPPTRDVSPETSSLPADSLPPRPSLPALSLLLFSLLTSWCFMTDPNPGHASPPNDHLPVNHSAASPASGPAPAPTHREIDEALVVRIRSGDRAAADELYRRHSQCIAKKVRKAARKLPGTDISAIAALADDAFLDAIRHYEVGGRWNFMTLLSNRLGWDLIRIDYGGPIRVKSNRRAPADSRRTADQRRATQVKRLGDYLFASPDRRTTLADILPSSAADPAALAELTELVELVHVVIARMPERLRLMIELRIAGKTLAAIARHCGITESRVSQQFHEAVGCFAELMLIAYPDLAERGFSMANLQAITRRLLTTDFGKSRFHSDSSAPGELKRCPRPNRKSA